MSASTITYSDHMAPGFMLCATDARGVDTAATAQGYVTLARRYER
ncbi:MAG TPA: hypothetical protein VME22_17100 [Solirubrobacteraceae bacterium]|nr:hypothetical protein [Solirubrobacteraceae bacterium]